MKPEPHAAVCAAADAAAARGAASPRISLIAWIEDPQRDPGALMVRIAKVMVGLSARWEAIVVHDPQTVPLGERLGPWLKAPGVRLVGMPTGTSAGAAVREALALADGDLAIVLDAPMQRCPECLHEIVQAWREGADAVRLAPLQAPVPSGWPSTALFRAWSGSEGLSPEWLGGLRLFSHGVLANLVPALETGVPEFTVWSVLTLPERITHPWSTITAFEGEPPGAGRRPMDALRRLAGGLGGAAFSASAMFSGLVLGASRAMAGHPFSRWAVAAALLLFAVLPLVLDHDAVAAIKRVEGRARPIQITGVGFDGDV